MTKIGEYLNKKVMVLETKKLQVKIDGSWKYVFATNPAHGIITTDKKEKALGARDLKHFQSKYANDEFRVLEHTEFAKDEIAEQLAGYFEDIAFNLETIEDMEAIPQKLKRKLVKIRKEIVSMRFEIEREL